MGCKDCLWYWNDGCGKVCHNVMANELTDDDCKFFETKFVPAYDVMEDCWY